MASQFVVAIRYSVGSSRTAEGRAAREAVRVALRGADVYEVRYATERDAAGAIAALPADVQGKVYAAESILL